jgi:hypothetical protein
MVYAGEIEVIAGKYWRFDTRSLDHWIEIESGETLMRARYGEGSIYPRGGTPDKYGKLKSGTWWICYFRNGVMHRESAHTLNKTQAQALLKKRSAEIVTGVFVTPKDQRITVDLPTLA